MQELHGRCELQHRGARIDGEHDGFQQGFGFFDNNGTIIQGWGNNEEQYYTSDSPNAAKNYNPETNSTENAFIKDGKLVLILSLLSIVSVITRFLITEFFIFLTASPLKTP